MEGYESTATSYKSSRTSHPLGSFYAKIKSPESAPVRDILEQFYESEGYVIKDGETRADQSQRV
jgi:hypothetical protein